METKVEALEDNLVKVTVTVDAKDVDGRIKKTYKEFASRYSFPGFRAGKAPRPVIDNALGAEAVRATVTDDIVKESFPKIVESEKLFPVANPEFDAEELVEDGKPYVFSVTVEVKPEFELSSYEPVAIELPAEGATDAEIEAELEGIREHYFDFVDANAATKIKEGSFVDLSIKASDDAGEPIEALSSESRIYEIGSGVFPETFDAEIMGLKKGQTKSFSIDVPAEGYSLMSQVAGKTEKVAFDVEVTVLKKKSLPELTDEWAKETLGFVDVADLRERIALTIKQQKDQMIPSMKENACLEKLIERLEDEAPEKMVEDCETTLLQEFFQQLQRNGATFDAYLAQTGLTPDQFKEDLKKQAVDMAKQDLALDAWARHFNLEVTDEAVTAEFLRSGAEDPAALEAEWRENGQLYLVRQGIARSSAMADVMEKAEVSEMTLPAAEEKPAKKAKKSSKKAEEETVEETPEA